MKTSYLALGLAAVASVGTLAADERKAEPTPTGTVTTHVFTDGNGSVYSANNIVGSGNTVITNADGQGRVYTQSTTKGRGNRIVVMRNGRLIQPEKIQYKGKDNKFWSKKAYDKTLKRDLFWDAKNRMWFEYQPKTDVYTPSTAMLMREMKRAQMEAKQAMRAAELEAQRTMQQVDQTMQEVDRLLQSLGGF